MPRGTNHLYCPIPGCTWSTKQRYVYSSSKLISMAEHLRNRHCVSLQYHDSCPCCHMRFDYLSEWTTHFIIKHKQIMALLKMAAHAKLLGVDVNAKA